MAAALKKGRVRRTGGIAQDITPHDGRFVYVIDGDEASRQSLSRLLREAGYDVRAFPSDEAFLSRRVMRRPDYSRPCTIAVFDCVHK